MTVRPTLEEYLERKYPFNVIADPDGGYVIVFPDLPGCMTVADDVDEIGPMAEDARRAWITTAYHRGMDIPALVAEQGVERLQAELAAARARIAALENQLDELGEGAYRAAAERDNRYVPQLHEWKGRAERAEAELARMRPVVEAAQRWHVAAQHYDAAMRSRDYGAADLADAELNAATERLIAAVAALDAAREEPR